MDLVKQFGTVVPEWYAGQCPIIDGGKAIIAPGGSSLMIAVDCATGKIVWQTPNPDGWGMTHCSIAQMTLNGKKMYIYCSTGGVTGVDAANGSVLWKTDAWKNKIANVSTPVVIGDGRIFLSSGYNLGAMMIRVSEQGGKFGVETLYSLKASVFGSDQQTPILYKGYIYGVRPNRQLVCLDLNGNVLWDSGEARFGMGPYTLAGGNIYLMNDTGVLTLAEATTSGYKQLAQAKILNGNDSWGPMAIAGGRLIARDLTRMVCVDIGRR
jgi:outer membrane protein assembly factor BamB